jgi:predicted amidohydrolase
VISVRERITVGIAQWLAVPGRPDENEAKAAQLIGSLASRGADLVVLPELWVCGYDVSTLAADAAAAAEPLSGPRVSWLGGLARRHRIWLAAGSVPERASVSGPGSPGSGSGGALFNTALLFGRDGGLVGWHRKFRLYSPLGEDRVFAAGSGVTVCRTEELGVVGLAVCFDGDFPETARALRSAGAELVLLPSAYEVGARTWWRTLYPAHALSNGQWWVMANQCGAHPSGKLLGESQIIAPDGEVVARASSVSPGEAGPETLVAEIDLAERLGAAAAANSLLWQAAR